MKEVNNDHNDRMNGRIHNRIQPYHIPIEQNCRHNHTVVNSSQHLSNSCSYSCSAVMTPPHNHNFSVDSNSNMQNNDSTCCRYR